MEELRVGVPQSFFNCLSMEPAMFDSDGNKTKMLRPRPRPIKQQQDYITKKTLLLQHACFSSKNNFVQKTSKTDMMTSYIWHCFRTYCTKKYRCLLHFSIIMSHSACRAQQCFKQDQKYKTKTKTKTKAARPRPRPRPVWDQSCHKTAVSDPKTG